MMLMLALVVSVAFEGCTATITEVIIIPWVTLVIIPDTLRTLATFVTLLTLVTVVLLLTFVTIISLVIFFLHGSFGLCGSLS